MSNSKLKKVKQLLQLTLRQKSAMAEAKMLPLPRNVGWHPLQMFPEELWRMIYENTKAPHAKLALMKSHPSLEEVFDDEGKCNWLFPAILPSLMETLKKLPDPIIRESIFALRLVSKCCCASIDDYLEEEWKKPLIQPPMLSLSLAPRGFLFNEEIVQFLEELKTHPMERNPFLSRSLTVEFADFYYERSIPRSQQVLNLAVLGYKFLKHLCLEMYVGNLEHFARFAQLALYSVPEVQKVCLNLEQIGVANPGFELRNRLPLPQLKNLKELKLQGNASVTIFQHIPFWIYFPQLTSLQIEFDLIKSMNLRDKLPNLIFFKIFSVVGRATTEKNLQDLMLTINSRNLIQIEIEARIGFGWRINPRGLATKWKAKRLAKVLRELGKAALAPEYQIFKMITACSELHESEGVPEVEVTVWFKFRGRKRAYFGRRKSAKKEAIVV